MGGYQGQHGIGADDSLDLLGRATSRSPLQELRDYPFFHLEEDQPAPSWVARHGSVCLIALSIIIASESIVLGLLLR